MARRVCWDVASLAGLAWAGLLLGLAAFGYCFPRAHTVYDIYARAGRNWWAGQDLYTARGTDYYRYSPLFAVGMTPFALLPDRYANPLWRLANGVLYAAGLAVWAARVLPRSPAGPAQDAGRAMWGAFLLLALPTSLHSLHNAQANLLMLGAILLGLAAAVSGRWNRAAAWLALATLVKGYPLALALLLGALYPRRFALRYAGALAVGLVLPFAAGRPAVVAAQYASWLGHLRDSTTIMRERLRSLDHLLALYGHPVVPRTFWAAEALAGAGVLILCASYRRRTPDLRAQLVVVLEGFAAWAALFGPATESCTYVIMAPAIAWALVDAFRRPAPWPGRFVLVLSLLLMGPLTTDLAGPMLRNFANEHGSQPVGALLFVVYLLVQTMRSQQGREALPLGRVVAVVDAAA